MVLCCLWQAWDPDGLPHPELQEWPKLSREMVSELFVTASPSTGRQTPAAEQPGYSGDLADVAAAAVAAVAACPAAELGAVAGRVELVTAGCSCCC